MVCDSIYIKLGNNTFISFIENKDLHLESIETIQLDLKNYKVKYTKNIINNNLSKTYNLSGGAFYIGDIINLNNPNF